MRSTLLNILTREDSATSDLRDFTKPVLDYMKQTTISKKLCAGKKETLKNCYLKRKIKNALSKATISCKSLVERGKNVDARSDANDMKNNKNFSWKVRPFFSDEGINSPQILLEET